MAVVTVHIAMMRPVSPRSVSNVVEAAAILVSWSVTEAGTWAGAQEGEARSDDVPRGPAKQQPSCPPGTPPAWSRRLASTALQTDARCIGKTHPAMHAIIRRLRTGVDGRNRGRLDEVHQTRESLRFLAATACSFRSRVRVTTQSVIPGGST